MLQKVENCLAKINETQISAFESYIGFKLPDDYKQFLLKFNGGNPIPRAFETKDKRIESLLINFYPLSDEVKENLVSTFNKYNKRNKIPYNLLSIGGDPVKNKVCLSVGGNDYGVVYYWQIEGEEPNYEPSYENMHIIADSFLKFLECLVDSIED